MKEYKQLQKFIIGFLIFYFIAGLSTEVFLPGREKDIPMFFSWFLFSHTPDEKSSSQYAVRILEFNDKTLNPPILFNEAYGIVDNPGSPKARALIRKLGPVTMMGTGRESEQLRKLFEQVYLPAPIRYELLFITYDPIQRFKTGEFISIKKLGEFTKNSQ
ncbi:hypothetical protein A2818_00895 [Candidatus Nomurabacteria bacterium RIFCSPHIGHO2_01_FULL_40_12]|uniref:Uncharacterized protein n=1 Tax=Candidatus Nomurabacteria bacterium RIFCSPHIGHO2_01_FULL_40_12 TaxID=1801737 RepID=A0A1F6UZG0_9BACT|nr:MAG: hypothetical protein A2818_00895 [Candidatus Nomurabacteria bacterium RIFCSPHIGHO2_01_FULL_40_12]